MKNIKEAMNIKIIFFILAIFIITGVVLSLMGQDFFGGVGFGFWSGEVNSQFNSQRLFDPYTFTHILHGFMFYFLLWLFVGKMPVWKRLLIVIGLECAWEILENTDMVIERYRQAALARNYYGDSIINSFGDIFAMIVGFLIVAKSPRWAGIILFFIIELLLVWWIRDGLILNIIQIIHPSDIINQWQASGGRI